MIYFVSSSCHSARDFSSFSLSLSGNGNLVHIIGAGPGADYLRRLGMSDFFTDYARLTRSSLPGEKTYENLTEQDFSILARDMIISLNDLATTIILEVGTLLSLAIARGGSLISPNMRVVYFCDNKCSPEHLLKQFEIRRPNSIIYSETEKKKFWRKSCSSRKDKCARSYLY